MKHIFKKYQKAKEKINLAECGILHEDTIRFSTRVAHKLDEMMVDELAKLCLEGEKDAGTADKPKGRQSRRKDV